MPLRNRSIWDKEGNVYFITTTVVNFEGIFSFNDSYPQTLIDSLKYLINEHRATLYAYVIMPSHIHLIIYIPEGESVSDFMRDFKKYTSTKLRVMMQEDGYLELVNKLMQNVPKGSKQTYKLWMDRFDDLILYTDKAIKTKVNYIHNNPVKASLVNDETDWKYSSARNYHLEDHSIIDVTSDWDVEVL